MTAVYIILAVLMLAMVVGIIAAARSRAAESRASRSCTTPRFRPLTPASSRATRDDHAAQSSTDFSQGLMLGTVIGSHSSPAPVEDTPRRFEVESIPAHHYTPSPSFDSSSSSDSGGSCGGCGGGD